MDWTNERYVRIYCRDTVEWEMLPWESRALWPNLLRKVDRAGILPLGRHGTKGLAALVKLPVEVVEPGLAGLLEDGCLVQEGDVLIVPNFISAQESKQSDRMRQEESRAKRRAIASTVTEGHRPSPDVTNRDEPSQNVTECHSQSHGVTVGHSVPCRAVLCLEDPPYPPQAGEVSEGESQRPPLELLPAEADPDRPTPERLVEIWNEATKGRIDPAKLEDRRKPLRDALRRQPDLAWWRKCFAHAARLKRDTDAKFLTLDWILAKSKTGWNYERVETGSFDFRLNDGKPPPAPNPYRLVTD